MADSLQSEEGPAKQSVSDLVGRYATGANAGILAWLGVGGWQAGAYGWALNDWENDWDWEPDR
jgi:hypothetical protein